MTGNPLLRYSGVLGAALLLYWAVIGPFTGYMKTKPFEEKLGYVPHANVIKYLAGDQQLFIASTLITKVLFYFGSVSDKAANKLSAPPDYGKMNEVLVTALKLDPYNMDAYYFSQAVFAWDVGRVKEVNAMMDYGMKYRTWDWYLPFFAGFNNAYFLKDYEKAAYYYKRAGELSGVELHLSLAGRYMYESGSTVLAIAYLKTILGGTKNEAVKRALAIRLKAFEGVRRIEIARDRFRNDTGRLPSSPNELVAKGYLPHVPVDPYGGSFYLEADGKVASTSRFAFGTKK